MKLGSSLGTGVPFILWCLDICLKLMVIVEAKTEMDSKGTRVSSGDKSLVIGNEGFIHSLAQSVPE